MSIGATASIAFGALGFEGLARAPALQTGTLDEIASRSQKLRRQEQEGSPDPVAPVLIGDFREDQLFVARLQIPQRRTVTLHRPQYDQISATILPAEGGGIIHLDSARLLAGAYRLCSGVQTLAFVILNDEQSLRAASRPWDSARILDHLGALDNAARFGELLELLDRHVLSKLDERPSSAPSSRQTSNKKEADRIDSEAPFGPRGVSMPHNVEAGSSRARLLNEGLIGDIISALIRALGAPPPPQKDGDAQDRDDGDVFKEPSSDQLARNLEAEPELQDVDWPRLVTACRKRLSLMITRLESRLMEAAAGAHTPAWAIGRMVIVLSLLQQLRKHPPQVKNALSGRLRPKSLVSLEHLKSAFGVAVRALYGSGRIAAKLEADANTRAAEERQLIDNLLLWFAREIGADCIYQPGENLEKSTLQNRADLIPVAMSAAAYPQLEPWAKHRDPFLSVWDDSLSIDSDWARRQLAFGQLLHRLKGVDVPEGKPSAAGKFVQWAGERDLPWVLASVSGKKAILLEPAAEKRVLVSSLRVLDPETLIRNFATHAA